MEATTLGSLVLVLALSTLLNSALGRRRSLQNVPFTGIGSVRPLRSSSSFSSSPPLRSSLNERELEVGWEPSTSPSSSPGDDDARASAINSSSSSSSSSAVSAIETIFTNSSVGEGDLGSTNSSAPTNISAVEQELIETLEVDQQVTVLGEVQLGELLCDSLVDAEDAPLLQFAISANETLLVNQTSYLVTGGESFTGGVARRTWIGNVIDPEQADDEAFPRRVSMTWGEVCDVETFSLEITTHHIDGNTSLTKSVPCGLSGLEICIVEVALDFLPDAPPLTVGFAGGRRLGGQDIFRGGQTPLGRASPGASARFPHVRESRKLQLSAVEIQALVLYSNQSLDMIGVSDFQMESLVSAAIVEVNEGFANSEIGIDLTIVHQTRLPYEEGSSSSGDKIGFMRENAEVQALRNEFGADLVVLVGELYDVCGIAYFLRDTSSWYSEYGYSLVNPNCFSNLVVAHEFGHNLGCDHNREHAGGDWAYAHGYRYCTGTDMYTTIMSYTSGCSGARANYFANPDVSFLDKPTGTETENCARAIQENKDVVANFREDLSPPDETCVVYTNACTNQYQGPALDDVVCTGACDEPTCCIHHENCFDDVTESDCPTGTTYDAYAGDCDGACDVTEARCCPASTCGNTFDYNNVTACASFDDPSPSSTLCSTGANGCDVSLCCLPHETCAEFTDACAAPAEAAPNTVQCNGACTAVTCCILPDETCADFSDACTAPAEAAASTVQCDGACTAATCCIVPDETCADFTDACTAPAEAAASTLQCDGTCTAATCCIGPEKFCGDEPYVCTDGTTLLEGASCGDDRNCTEAKCCPLDVGGAMSSLFSTSTFVALFGVVAATAAVTFGGLPLF